MTNEEIDYLLKLMNEDFEERQRKAAEEEFKRDIIFRKKFNEFLPAVPDQRILLQPVREEDPPYQMRPGQVRDVVVFGAMSNTPMLEVIILRLPNDEYLAFRFGCLHRASLNDRHDLELQEQVWELPDD